MFWRNRLAQNKGGKVLKKSSVLLFAFIIVLNLSGCASIPGLTTEPKELKLKWNVSYVRGLVLVKEALKSEPIRFETAMINKDGARLKGNYPDGKIIQIVIAKISNSESSVAVNLGSSLAAKEDAKKILEVIAQYAQQKK